MQFFGRSGRRVALALGAAGLAAGLAGTAAFALFTSTANSQTDSFAAGTVTLTKDSSSFDCNITNMEPGDSSTGYAQGAHNDKPCTYVIDYSGTLNAWVGLDVSVSSTAAPNTTPSGSQTSQGGAALMDNGDGALGVTISGSTTLNGNTVPTTFSVPNLSCSNISDTGSSVTDNGYQEQCTGSSTNQFFKGAFKNPSNDDDNDQPTGSWINGETGTITVDYGLPLASDNTYQGGKATITLTAHAVQASNNPLSSSGVPTYWSNADLPTLG